MILGFATLAGVLFSLFEPYSEWLLALACVFILGALLLFAIQAGMVGAFLIGCVWGLALLAITFRA